MTDSINQDGSVPDPMSNVFSLTPADREAVRPINAGGGWVRVGSWRYRQFGREIQLRSDKLPHVPIDVWRVEAEALFVALGSILGKPAPMPYRAPWHERLRMWWLRRVWNRKHARELDEARQALMEETLRGLPQMDDAKHE